MSSGYVRPCSTHGGEGGGSRAADGDWSSRFRRRGGSASVDVADGPRCFRLSWGGGGDAGGGNTDADAEADVDAGGIDFDDAGGDDDTNYAAATVSDCDTGRDDDGDGNGDGGPHRRGLTDWPDQQ